MIYLKDSDINFEYEVYSIIKHNKLLAEHTKKRLDNCYPNIYMKTIFLNTENSKTTESRIFAFIFLQLFNTCLFITP